jgi:hypothetical protein
VILRDILISPITGKMEESDPPPPPTKGGFKGKRIRSRSLSRVPKKHPNNQKKRKAQQPLPPSMILLILQPPTQLSPTNLLFLCNSSILPRIEGCSL